MHTRITVVAVLLVTGLGACLREEVDLCSGPDYAWECTCPDAQADGRKFDYVDERCDVCSGADPDSRCSTAPKPRDGGLDAGDANDGAARDGAAGDGATRDDAGPTPDGGRDAGRDGGAVQCSVTCSGSKPHCDPDSDTCEACVEDAHCIAAGGGTPHCMGHVCVECRAGETSDCASDPDGTVCAAGTCAECAVDADCTDPNKARCTASHECVPCDADVQCAARTNGGGDPIEVCATGQCVECTGAKYAACLEGATQYVCDSVARTCSNKQPMSATLCQTCVSDAQCMTGQLCAHTQFGLADTGAFCLWRQDALGDGGCLNVRPFIGVTTTWSSVDGVVAPLCFLASTTCQGLESFKDACPSADATGDAMCGASGVPDAFCMAIPGGGFQCTTPCGGDTDCQNIVAHDDECQPKSVSTGTENMCVFQ